MFSPGRSAVRVGLALAVAAATSAAAVAAPAVATSTAAAPATTAPVAAGPAATSAGRWAAEVHLGGAWNLPVPLVIRQAGEDELSFRSRWRTRAFEPPFYYVVRLMRLGGRGGWALDLTHHKIHLVEPPGEIANFAVSHGYNLVTLQRLIEDGHWRYGFGAGLVVAHPENEVRGRRLAETGGPLGGGYHLAGPTAGGLLSWLPGRRDGLHPLAEARITLSWARVPVSGGHARAPNVAFHLTAGVGWR